MSDFASVSHKGFAVRRNANLSTSLQPLLLLVIGVAVVSVLCLASLIAGLLSGLFGAGWLS